MELVNAEFKDKELKVCYDATGKVTIKKAKSSIIMTKDQLFGICGIIDDMISIFLGVFNGKN